MGWITRRIAGSVTFVIVSAILTAWAIAAGHLSGSPTLSTAWGAGILGVAFLVSLAVTHRMKVQDQSERRGKITRGLGKSTGRARTLPSIVADDGKAHGPRSRPDGGCSSSSV